MLSLLRFDWWELSIFIIPPFLGKNSGHKKGMFLVVDLHRFQTRFVIGWGNNRDNNAPIPEKNR